MYHPWRTLRAMPHVTLHWATLAGRTAQTDGTTTVTMDSRQLQVERRCAIAHEIVHVERGHTGHCDPRTETDVRATTARRLIALPALIDALAWGMSLDEVAEECWVTLDVLRDRLDHLTTTEAEAIARATLRRDDPA